jgi:hypothetical protein
LSQILTSSEHVLSLEDFQIEICFLTLNDKMVIDVYVLGHGFYYETYF